MDLDPKLASSSKFDFRVPFTNDISRMDSGTRLEKWVGFNVPTVPYAIWSKAAESGSPIYLVPSYPTALASAEGLGTVQSILSVMATTSNSDAAAISTLKGKIEKRLGKGAIFVLPTVPRTGPITYQSEIVAGGQYSLPVLYLQLGPNTKNMTIKPELSSSAPSGPCLYSTKVGEEKVPSCFELSPSSSNKDNKKIAINMGKPTYITASVATAGSSTKLVKKVTTFSRSGDGFSVTSLGDGNEYTSGSTRYNLGRGVFIAWEGGGSLSSDNRLQAAKNAIDQDATTNYRGIGNQRSTPGLISIQLPPYFIGGSYSGTARFSMKFI